MSISPPISEIQHFQNLPWKSKVKVIAQGHKEGITPYRLISLCSMSICHPIPGIPLFQNWTLKIQGQGHGWGQSWKSQHRSNIQSTHIPFVLCQSAIPFLSYDFFKIWPWKSQVKVMGEVTVQSHNVDLSILSTRIHFVPCQSGTPFLSYNFFKIDLEKSRVKVMGEVTVSSKSQCGSNIYRLTSLWFHVNRPSHSWDTAFSKFDLENLGSRSNDHDVANYGSKQFQRTLNGINPSSGFNDKRSTKPGPSAAWFDKFLACGQARIYLSLSQSEPKGGN